MSRWYLVVLAGVLMSVVVIWGVGLGPKSLGGLPLPQDPTTDWETNMEDLEDFLSGPAWAAAATNTTSGEDGTAVDGDRLPWFCPESAPTCRPG